MGLVPSDDELRTLERRGLLSAVLFYAENFGAVSSTVLDASSRVEAVEKLKEMYGFSVEQADLILATQLQTILPDRISAIREELEWIDLNLNRP
ncbi:hypothetical protein GCM10023217_03630 [Gordonia alkaliphila]|uniref:DNA topoisomerase (ATP-hydrolyzing) n=1 Tax=Gordonia alkaliphila TaxID=1053547 RepID=A0ABP8YXQ2_9ACTN